MKQPIKSFEIIKEMYEYFVKKYRDLEPKLMICEKEDFDNVEIALKDYEKKTKLAKEYEDVNNVAKRLKAFEIIKESCEFDFIKKEENDKPIRYEVHIRRKGGDNIFFPCLAIYPKNQQEFDLLKEVLL